jgi:hypothetical protein
MIVSFGIANVTFPLQTAQTYCRATRRPHKLKCFCGGLNSTVRASARKLSQAITALGFKDRGKTNRFERSRLHRLVKNPSQAGVLKGHDFNRAAKAIESTPGFSPCGMFSKTLPRYSTFSPSCSVVPQMPENEPGLWPLREGLQEIRTLPKQQSA